MRVGRQLAIIADDVNARYSNDFNKMVRQLRVDQNTAYDAFAGVARQLVLSIYHHGTYTNINCTFLFPCVDDNYTTLYHA